MPASRGGLWIFAGSNGAGKTTSMRVATGPGGSIAGTPILNPDQLTKTLLDAAGYPDYSAVPDEVYRRCFIQAAAQMELDARRKLRAGENVCIETVLSTRKYLPLVDAAAEAGVPFQFVYVVLRSPELACERVALRVRRGGHPAPPDKIVSRYWRSLENLSVFAARATRFWVYDNSYSGEAPPKILAEGENGKLLSFDPDSLPHVLERLRALPRA